MKAMHEYNKMLSGTEHELLNRPLKDDISKIGYFVMTLQG
jgi:hypothetical protein